MKSVVKEIVLFGVPSFEPMQAGSVSVENMSSTRDENYRLEIGKEVDLYRLKKFTNSPNFLNVRDPRAFVV